MIHFGNTPVAPQVYANVGGWRTPEVQRSKEPFIELWIFLRQYAKDYDLGYIQTATPTGKLTARPGAVRRGCGGCDTPRIENR